MFSTPLPTSPSFDDQLSLGEVETSEPRYGYVTPMAEERSWVQVIDFNGDGRLDIVTANENNDYWVLYLNLPDENDPQRVLWKWRNIRTDHLRETLLQWGFHIPSTQGLPLSRSQTGRNTRHLTCFYHFPGTPGDEWDAVECDPQLPDPGPSPQSSMVEWKLADVNGDGYPDFVVNSSPVGLFREPTGGCVKTAGGEIIPPAIDPAQAVHASCIVEWQFRVRANRNELRVFYNRAGVRLSGDPETPNSTIVFSRPKELGQSPCPLEWWEPAGVLSVMRCGLVDVNGDGLLDRAEGKAVRLGNGETFHNVIIQLPGYAAELQNWHDACTAANPEAQYLVVRGAGLLDVTGDGIPDYVKRDLVHIGTGVGFLDSIRPNISEFEIAVTEDACDQTSVSLSKTTSGLLDINGDGRPDMVRADGDQLHVMQLVGDGGGIGAHDAGRLTQIFNGYGAVTMISYESAKEDSRTCAPSAVSRNCCRQNQREGGKASGHRFSVRRPCLWKCITTLSSIARPLDFPGLPSPCSRARKRHLGRVGAAADPDRPRHNH